MSIKLVGEIGINHNGDMDLVRKLMGIADVAGLDYVKFQKRNINSCYTKEMLDGPRESPYGTTQRDQKEGIELTESDYKRIDNLYSGKWFASPWDVNSVLFLANFDIPYIKIASACLTDFDLLEAVANTGKPVIISTGMSTKDEVDKCLEFLGSGQVEYILACKSTYPTKDEEMNLNFIKTLKNEYPKYKIGFSNHNSGIQMCLAAAVLGAEMIEFHMTLDRAMYGSDQGASIEPNGTLKIGHHVRALETAMGSADWLMVEGEKAIREKLRK